jgi:hypothetical protein
VDQNHGVQLPRENVHEFGPEIGADEVAVRGARNRARNKSGSINADVKEVLRFGGSPLPWNGSTAFLCSGLLEGPRIQLSAPR